MNADTKVRQKATTLLAIALIGCIWLAGCNYPGVTAESASPTTPPTSAPVLPEPTATPTLASQPSNTPQATETSAPTATTGPSETPAAPAATATLAWEQVGVVILNGNQIGIIKKSGDLFVFIAPDNSYLPEVSGKVVLQVKDPDKKWNFDLDSTSSNFFHFKDDPRPGWEGYGILVVYEGVHDVTLRFTVQNAQTGEKVKGRIVTKMLGETVQFTPTPEM